MGVVLFSSVGGGCQRRCHSSGKIKIVMEKSKRDEGAKKEDRDWFVIKKVIIKSLIGI